MVWRGWQSDPNTDEVAPAVLAAFDAAQRDGLPTADCYLAGVEVWRRAHPDQAPEYASKQAVDVIIGAKVSLRVPEA